MDQKFQFFLGLFPFLVFGFILIAILIRRRMTRTISEPDHGQFELKSWKLEEELDQNPAPRSVQPKNLRAEKRKYYLAMSLPLLVIFVFIGFTMSSESLDSVGFKHFMRGPVLFLVGAWFFIFLLTRYFIQKKLQDDLELLQSGTPVGARIVKVVHHKNQISFRVKFILDGVVQERTIQDSFSHMLKASPLAEGSELTVLVHPRLPNSIGIYKYLHAEIVGVESYR